MKERTKERKREKTKNRLMKMEKKRSCHIAIVDFVQAWKQWKILILGKGPIGTGGKCIESK